MLIRSLALATPLLLAHAGADAHAQESAPAVAAPSTPGGPALPPEAAEEVRTLEAALESAMASLVDEAADGTTRSGTLGAAMDAAQRLVSVRAAHQGNAESIRWRDDAGAPSEWSAVRSARATLEDLRTLASLDDEQLAEWARLKREYEQAAEVYGRGRLVDAKNILVAVVEGQRDLVGDAHLDTAGALRSLAVVRQNMYEVEEARDHLREALGVYRERLGPEHPTTLTTVNTLALALNASGDSDGARALFSSALVAQERIAGPDDPSTLVTVLNLGFIELAGDETDRALERFERAYGGLRDALGETHPTTLTAAEGVGVALQRLGRLADAEAYYLGVEAGRRRALGAEHIDTLRAASNVATIHAMQDRLAEADFRFTVVTEGRRRHLGEGHPLFLEAAGDLASVQLRQGRFESAEAFASRVLDGWRRTLGEDHPETIDALERLALVRLESGRAPEALPDLLRVERARADRSGADGRGAIDAGLRVGEALLALGRHDEAAERFGNAADQRIAAAGEDDPRALEALRSLAVAQLLSENAPAAIGTLDRASTLLASRHGQDHPDTLAALALRARAAAIRSTPRGERELTELRERCERELGAHAPPTINATHALARAVESTDPARALALYAAAFEGVLAMRAEAVPRHAAPGAVEVACDSARLLIAGARHDEAYAVTQRARAHRLFDDLARAGMERTVLRAVSVGRDERARYEELLNEETAARAVARERELRHAADPTAVPPEDLASARTRRSASTSAVFRFVADAAPVLAARTAAGVLASLGDGEAHLDLVTSERSVIAFAFTHEGVRGRVIADDRAEAGRVREATLALRDRLVLPPDKAESLEEHTAALRGLLLPAEVRGDPGVGVRAVSVTASAPFDRVPMGLLIDDLLVRRAAPVGPLASGSDPSGPDFGVGMGALALNAMPREEADLYLGPLTDLTPNGVIRVDTRSSSPDELRQEIAAKRPERLHLLMPAWLDARTISSRLVTASGLADLGPTLTVYDLLEIAGPNLAGTDLVVAPLTASAHPSGDGIGDDTFGPMLLLAGVDAAVYALWDVDPVAGVLLTGRLYANTTGRRKGVVRVGGDTYAAGDPMPAGDALREAREWLRTLSAGVVDDAFVEMDLTALVTASGASDPEGERPFAHPHYWSGFVIAGGAR